MSKPFETARFFEALEEVGDMLAELGFIDLAKPYLEGVAWNATFDMHDVVLGERHPFMVRVCTEDDDHWARIREQLGDYAETAADSASGDVEALVEATRAIVGFVPARHRQTVEQLARIHDFLLREGAQDLGQLERSLDDWTGSAADTFALDFYQPLELVHANQCYLLGESAKAMTMAIGVYETAQQALMNAVLAARDVLDDQLRARAGGKGGPSSKDFLTVAAAALTVVTSLRFLSPPAAAALTVANIGVGLVRQYAVDDEDVAETATIEASSAEEVAAALSREAGFVQARTDRALTNLSGEFAPVRGAMSDMLDDDRLHPPRPGLSADTPTSRFHFQA